MRTSGLVTTILKVVVEWRELGSMGIRSRQQAGDNISDTSIEKVDLRTCCLCIMAQYISQCPSHNHNVHTRGGAKSSAVSVSSWFLLTYYYSSTNIIYAIVMRDIHCIIKNVTCVDMMYYDVLAITYSAQVSSHTAKEDI